MAHMVDVNVSTFEIEVRTRHGDLVRADVYLPREVSGPFPVLLGASPYQKMLRHLPVITSVFPFIEYGPMQLYLDEGYAYVAMDTPGAGRSEGVWDPVSRTEGEAIHDMIEHVAGLDWSNGRIGKSSSPGTFPRRVRYRSAATNLNIHILSNLLILLVPVAGVEPATY
jgi:predicted acyl esterase